MKRKRICRLQLNQLLVGHNVRARLKCGAHGQVFHGRPLAVLHQFSAALFFIRLTIADCHMLLAYNLGVLLLIFQARASSKK